MLGWSFHLTTCVVVVVVMVVRAVEAVEVIEAGPEFSRGGGGEETLLEPPLDWNDALRLTLGDGLSEPASEDEVVWLEDPRESMLQDDMSKDLGREVFIRTRRSNVETLKMNEKYRKKIRHKLVPIKNCQKLF